MTTTNGMRPLRPSQGLVWRAPPRNPLQTALGLVVVGLLTLAIGWVDYLSGVEVGFSLFYLLPVAGCAWWLGMGPAVVAAVLASAAWFFADAALRNETQLTISVWNGTTRLVIFVTIGVLIGRLREDRDRLRVLTIRLRELLEREAAAARTDALTGLLNTRAFLEALQIEISRSDRSGCPLCVGYLDLDNFKQVNDTYGHQAGDELLQEIAEALRDGLRTVDVPSRLGGDEFGVLFVDADPGSAGMVANRLLDKINELGGRYPGSELGVSIGIAIYHDSPGSVTELLGRADAAMYEAKRLGRRQVVIWNEQPES